MKLERAREIAAELRKQENEDDDISIALIVVDHRITELESENEKLRDLVEDASEIMTLRDRAVEEQHNRAERLKKIIIELGGVEALPIGE